ncbi:hypothetical protein PQX77_013121 [Marasmius sp. AFHP31]|nr:hypothetical protein PQX77_013121 [Marasmius sp. AFHP31]
MVSTRLQTKKGLKNSAEGVETPVNLGESPLTPSISTAVVPSDDGNPVPKGAQAKAVRRSRTEGRPLYSNVVAAAVRVTERSDSSDDGSAAGVENTAVRSRNRVKPVLSNVETPAQPGPDSGPGRVRNKTVVDNPGWITPRKARSLEDLRRKKNTSTLRFQVPRDHLSADQSETVRLAEARLTPSQRNAIKMRQEKVKNTPETGSSDTQSSSDSSSDPETGRIPAELKRKGKAVEGDVPDDLSDIEVDMAAQVAAYEKFYNEHRGASSSKSKARARDHQGSEGKDPEDQEPDAC